MNASFSQMTLFLKLTVKKLDTVAFIILHLAVFVVFPVYFLSVLSSAYEEQRLQQEIRIDRQEKIQKSAKKISATFPLGEIFWKKSKLLSISSKKERATTPYQTFFVKRLDNHNKLAVFAKNHDKKDCKQRLNSQSKRQPFSTSHNLIFYVRDRILNPSIPNKGDILS